MINVRKCIKKNEKKKEKENKKKFFFLYTRGEKEKLEFSVSRNMEMNFRFLASSFKIFE